MTAPRHPGPATGPDRRVPWLVVGVGPTRDSRGALLWALHEAERRDGTVLAVSVWGGGPDDERAVREVELVARVRDAVEETGVRGRTRVQLVAGPVADVLTALSEQADVLVVGPHHRAPDAG